MWQERALQKAKDSAGTRQREGAVCATVVALAMLEVLFEQARLGSKVFLRDRAALLDAVGHPRIAKDGPTRTAFLTSLFRLAVVSERIPWGTDGWDAVIEAFANAADLKEVARRCAESADALIAQYPTRLETSARFAPLVEGRRGGDGFLRFAGGLLSEYEEGSVELATLDRVAQSIARGTAAADRRATLTRDRFPQPGLDDGKLRALFDAYDSGARESADEMRARLGLPENETLVGAELLDSGCLFDWQRAVDDIRSCQSSDGAPELNRGMLNRMVDGTVRLIALRDGDGKTRARAALRLVTLDGQEPALFLEHLYAPVSKRVDAQTTHALVSTFVRERARALGLPLVVGDTFHSDAMPSTHTLSFPDLLGPDYFDLLRTGVREPGAADAITTSLCVERPAT
jgi:hypothetical protein